jgi:hypothetical protein
MNVKNLEPERPALSELYADEVPQERRSPDFHDAQRRRWRSRGHDRTSAVERAANCRGATTPPNVALSSDLNVVKNRKGPVMTTLDEFYKVGPGPSSSHTIGPMRITYDFYQRASQLPADQLARRQQSRCTFTAA